MSTDRRRLVSVAAAVAAVYFAFLLCAQFGFLAQLERALGAEPRALQGALAAMAVAGVAAGVAAARTLVRRSGRGAVRAGLLAVAVACAASIGARQAPTLVLAAAGLGAALGWATVALAGSLVRLAPAGAAGRAAGFGTGAAYLLANLPPLFAGDPALRAAVPAAACVLAAGLLPSDRTPPPERLPQAGERSHIAAAGGFPALVMAFLLLVALDSAAFAAIQHDSVLLAVSWGGDAHAMRQGLVHLLAACAAGVALDRGGLRALLLAAGASFAIALPALGAGAAAAALAAPLYAVGISAYSAALVAAPSLAGGAVPRTAASRAAWLFGVAGWLGSGLGVGAAKHLGWPVIAGAALAVLGAVAALLAPSVRGRARETALALAVGACGGFVALRSPAPADDPVARGRQVYLAEGCQHCHSQYVRPVAQDALWWGPRRELDRREHPPTPGNRRIGPDLANVGVRRAALWQERHLRDPRALSPASSMPSYAHLFATGERRGSDLVAYLGSLGAGAEAARLATIRRAPMAAAPQVPSASRGARLFARHCAPCHGEGGRGDGGALGDLALPGLDLREGALRRARDYGVDEPLERAVARVIRFGLPPWLMPGHEWLSAQEVGDLAAFVIELSASGDVRVAAR